LRAPFVGERAVSIVTSILVCVSMVTSILVARGSASLSFFEVYEWD